MKKYILCLLFLLLLTACQSTPQQAESPTPEPTPTPTVTVTPMPTGTATSAGFLAPEGLELDVGDGEHKFWIEITEREEEVGGVWVNIYRDKEDAESYQRFEDRVLDFHRAVPRSVDADFDGNVDFYFERDWGSLPAFWFNHYIWDATEERFVQDPYGLNDIPNVRFDPERKVVTSWENRATVCYQYEDGQLVRVSERFCPEEDDIVKAYSGHRVKVDEDHVFWVELVDTDAYNLMVNIYEKPTDCEPVQSFEDQCECSFERIHFYVEDVDFDGDMDFSFITARGHFSVSYSSYYIWDGEKFVPDPYGLNEVCYANFHPETKIVESIRINSIASHEIQLYRYIDGKLTCLRELLTWDPSGNEQKLTVLDWKNGEWVTAYETIIDFTKLEPGDEFDPEFSRWHDLDYHGE